MWTLLLVLYSAPVSMPVLDVTKPEPTHAEQGTGKIDPRSDAKIADPSINKGPLNTGGIEMSVVPSSRVDRMTGVQTDVTYNAPAPVQIKFPTEAGCRAASTVLEKFGQSICFEVK